MADTSDGESASFPRASTLLRRSVFGAAGLLLLALAGAMLVPAKGLPWLTSSLLLSQDIWIAAAIMAIAAAALVVGRPVQSIAPLGAASIWGLAIAVVAVAYGGRYWVLENFDLVRDEQLVGFDAWIYRHGHLTWPIPPAWRAHADALNLIFMYPVKNPGAWVSAYLPGNAMLHAIVGSLTDPALTSPLLAGGSTVLLWSCARKLWPDDPPATTISVLVLVLSGQFLVAAMSTWAMTAHLFFNLLWLRLFLADRRWCDLAAILVGAFATGLHQPLFHPMFAAPFLAMLLLERKWARLLPFVLGYAALCLFWISWPGWIEGMVIDPGRIAAAAVPPTSGGFLARLHGALASNTDNLTLTSANLVRFIVWGNIGLLPLIFAAWPDIRKGGLPAALAASFALPFVALAILLPWQGYGFGYRYAHPALGAAALLAGYGWRNLSPVHALLRPAALVLATGMVLVILPMQFVMSHRFVHANALASRTIDASKTDYALIHLTDGVGYANIVFNRPDLSNRPIRLIADFVPDHAKLAASICHPGVVIAMPQNAFFQPGAAYYGVKPFDTADATMARLRVPYEAAGCRIVALR